MTDCKRPRGESQLRVQHRAHTAGLRRCGMHCYRGSVPCLSLLLSLTVALGLALAHYLWISEVLMAAVLRVRLSQLWNCPSASHSVVSGQWLCKPYFALPFASCWASH